MNTDSTTTSQTYTWTAPSCDSSSSASFRALCGAGGSIDAGRGMDFGIYMFFRFDGGDVEDSHGTHRWVN